MCIPSSALPMARPHVCIDHCLSSSPLHAKIQSISVLCDITVSDHMPLVIELQLQPTAVAAPVPEPPRPPKLNWKSASVRSITAYNDLILQQLVSFHSDIIDDMYINCLANCVYDHHMHHLSRFTRFLLTQ